MKAKNADRFVLAHLKRTKGYTNIFYVIDRRWIARAFTRLDKKGMIVRDRSRESGFPVMYFCTSAEKAVNQDG